MKNTNNINLIIIHICAIIFGLILIYCGVYYNLIIYILFGMSWIFFNFIFLYYGENFFNKYIPYNSILFSLIFMLVPIFYGILIIIYSYKYNNIFIRYFALLVVLCDMYHISTSNFFILIILLIIIIIIRKNNKVHYDDLNPLIPNKIEYMDKANILFVIPKYKNKKITEFPDFIEKVKKYANDNNKELALHGVTHYPEGYFIKAEFGIPRSKEYIQEGIDIFEEAFGFKPKLFKAPCYNLLPENCIIIESLGLKVIGSEALILNKVYHYDRNTKVMYFFNKFTEFI
jgi:hypothetical protein